MLAFLPTGLAPWEIVAFSALCAISALSIATAIGATVAYLATRPPRAVRQSAPARVAQPRPQPASVIPAAPNPVGVAG
jgi:hypothetical protein